MSDQASSQSLWVGVAWGGGKESGQRDTGVSGLLNLNRRCFQVPRCGSPGRGWWDWERRVLGLRGLLDIRDTDDYFFLSLTLPDSPGP